MELGYNIPYNDHRLLSARWLRQTNLSVMELTMKLNALLKTFLAGFLAFSCITAQATPVTDDERLLDQAVQDFLEHMNKGETGLAGAMSKISDCYESPSSNKLYCLYYDYTARILDAQVREVLGMKEPLEFFSDDAFGERVAKHVYIPKGSNFAETNAHLNMLFYKIQDRMNKAIQYLSA